MSLNRLLKKEKDKFMLQYLKSYLDLAGDPGKEGELRKEKLVQINPQILIFLFWFKSPHNYCSINLNSTYQRNGMTN